MKIKILGTGGAFDELSTSYLINDTTLVDCSDAIIHKYALSGQLDKLKNVFFTHRHADHINGLETLIYYFSVKNLNFSETGLTIYGSSDILEYYKGLACCINPITGEYHMPFKFVNLDMKEKSISLGENVFVENIEAKHMNGTIPCNSFIFSEGDRTLIITGDMDTVNPLISKEISRNRTLIFHDMGWTGLPDVPNNMKYHPTEEEVYEFYGDNLNLIGIHTKAELKHYRKAKAEEVYFL